MGPGSVEVTGAVGGRAGAVHGAPPTTVLPAAQADTAGVASLAGVASGAAGLVPEASGIGRGCGPAVRCRTAILLGQCRPRKAKARQGDQRPQHRQLSHGHSFRRNELQVQFVVSVQLRPLVWAVPWHERLEVAV